MVLSNKKFYNNFNLIKDLDKNFKRPFIVYDKSLIIVKEYLALKFKLYNGQEFNEIIITEDKIGHRFGEFIITKKKHKYVKKKKK